MWFSKFVIRVCRHSANSVAHELASVGRLYPANHYVEYESDVPAQVAACVAGDLPGTLSNKALLCPQKRPLKKIRKKRKKKDPSNEMLKTVLVVVVVCVRVNKIHD